MYCIASWEPAFEEPSTGKFYITFLCISVILIPFSLLAGIYTVIVLVLLRQKNIIRGQVRGGISRDKMHKNVLRMAVTIVVIFAICWAPLNINLLLLTFFGEYQNAWCTSSAFAFTAEFLVIANTAFNPFIYFCFLGIYRRSLCNAISGLFIQSRVRKAIVRFIPKRREAFELTSIPRNEAGLVQVVSSTKLHTVCESKDRVVESEKHQAT